jgi:hypothetical protein
LLFIPSSLGQIELPSATARHLFDVVFVVNTLGLGTNTSRANRRL